MRPKIFLISVLSVQSAHDKTTHKVIGPAMAQNSLKSRESLSSDEISMKGDTIVCSNKLFMNIFTLDLKTQIRIKMILLTAMAVAGRKIIVNRAMLFMAEESRLVSRAICCCIRLYSCVHLILVHSHKHVWSS